MLLAKVTACNGYLSIDFRRISSLQPGHDTIVPMRNYATVYCMEYSLTGSME